MGKIPPLRFSWGSFIIAQTLRPGRYSVENTILQLWEQVVVRFSAPARVTQAVIHFIQVEMFRIEFSAGPLLVFIMLGMFWIAYRFQELLIAPYTAHILWRASPFARNTKRIAYTLFRWQDFFHDQLVFPTIPKIIFIAKFGSLAPKRLIQLEPGFIFGSEIPILIIFRVAIDLSVDGEHVQVIVLPAHDDL
jgi:hypothetical protein